MEQWQDVVISIECGFSLKNDAKSLLYGVKVQNHMIYDIVGQFFYMQYQSCFRDTLGLYWFRPVGSLRGKLKCKKYTNNLHNFISFDFILLRRVTLQQKLVFKRPSVKNI